MGLLNNAREISTLLDWERRLNPAGPRNPRLCFGLSAQVSSTNKAKIQRHKAAIASVAASKPVHLAVEAGLLPDSTTYFNYGCGHSADIEYIRRLGHFNMH